jgi:hypothetical protein
MMEVSAMTTLVIRRDGDDITLEDLLAILMDD